MGELSRRRLLTGAAALGGSVIMSQAGAGGAPAAAAPPAPAAGAITVPRGDPRHISLTRGQNQRFASDPDYVVLPHTTGEVVKAVQTAVRDGLRLTVRSGGHCYENFVDNPEVRVIVDMTQMREISYDPSRRAIMVEAGANLGEVYHALYRRWGVTLPGGSCHPVGVGGHVSGAGYGQISRLFGLIVDHVYAVEVVVVDRAGKARAVVATAEPSDPHRPLWWAHTGGGGGSFGVVTRFWFRSPTAVGRDPLQLLPTAPAQAWVSSVTWSWDQLNRRNFTRLLRNYGGWHEANSTAGGPYAGLFARLELNTAASGEFSMIVHMDASRSDSERLMRAFIDEVNDGVGAVATLNEHRRLPWLHATGWPGLWLSVPTDRYKYKGSYQRRGFSETQLDAFYRTLSRTDYAQPPWVVSIASYGGQVNQVSPRATATPHRDSVMKLLWGVGWANADDDELHLNFHRTLFRDVHADTGGVPVPNAVTDGCFINYADVDLGDPVWNTSGVPWHDLYWKENYPRLQRVKQAYDPSDFFRHAQSIRLPGA